MGPIKSNSLRAVRSSIKTLFRLVKWMPRTHFFSAQILGSVSGAVRLLSPLSFSSLFLFWKHYVILSWPVASLILFPSFWERKQNIGVMIIYRELLSRIFSISAWISCGHWEGGCKKFKRVWGVYVRVECRCLSGFSSSLIVGPGFELAWVPGGGVNCNDMQGQTDTRGLVQVDTTIAGIFCILADRWQDILKSWTMNLDWHSRNIESLNKVWPRCLMESYLLFVCKQLIFVP